MEGGTDGTIEYSENFLLISPFHFYINLGILKL